MQGNRRLISFTAATIFMTGILATGALAALVSSASTALLRIENRSNNDSQTTTLTSFTDLNGASVLVSIPAAGRLIRARFTGKSICEGTIGVSCVMRIVALNTATSTILELNPQSGFNFSFGTTSGDTANAHAMERSRRILTAGSYRIKVQFALNGTGSAFHLDDWHFTVETFQ